MVAKRRATKGDQTKAAKSQPRNAAKATPEPKASTRGSSKRKASPSPAKKAAPAKKSRAASPSPAPTNRTSRGRSQSNVKPAEVRSGRSQSKKNDSTPSHVTRTALQQVETKQSARSRSSTKPETPATPQSKAATPKQKAESTRTRTQTPKQSAATPSQKAQTPKSKATTPKSRAQTPKQKAASSRSRSQTPKAKVQTPQQKANQKQTPRQRSATPKQKAANTKVVSKKKPTPPKQKSSRQVVTPKRKTTSPAEKKSTPIKKSPPAKVLPEKSSPPKRTTSRSRATKIDEEEKEVVVNETDEEKTEEKEVAVAQQETDEVKADEKEIAEKITDVAEEVTDVAEKATDEVQAEEEDEDVVQEKNEADEAEEKKIESVEKAVDITQAEEKEDDATNAEDIAEEDCIEDEEKEEVESTGGNADVQEKESVVESVTNEAVEEQSSDEKPVINESNSAAIVANDVEDTEEQMEVEDEVEDVEGEEDENVEQDQKETIEQPAESETAVIEKEAVQEEDIQEVEELPGENNEAANEDDTNDAEAESEQIESEEKECETVESEQVESGVIEEKVETGASVAIDVDAVVDVDEEDSDKGNDEPILVQNIDDNEPIDDSNDGIIIGSGDAVPADDSPASKVMSVQEISDEEEVEEIGVTQAAPILIPADEKVNEVNTTGIEIGQEAVEIIEDDEPLPNGATGDGLSPRKRKHDELDECSQDEDIPMKKARVSLDDGQVENGAVSQEVDIVKDYVVVEMEDVPASNSEEVVKSLPVETMQTNTISSGDEETSNPVLTRTFIPNPTLPGNIDSSKQFSLVSYNILADCHLLRNDYSFTESKFLESSYRLSKVIEELSYLDADVMCLQEVSPSFFEGQLLPALKSSGYDGIFIKRTSDYCDEGEATFYRTSKFSLVESSKASFANLAEKVLDGVDETVQAAVRQYLDRPEVFIVSRLRCNATGQEVTIGNVHIHWGEMKLPDVQCVQIASAVKEIVKQAGADNFPHIICGDFNSPPNSPGYLVARDGYPSGDETITTLQQVIGLQLQEEQKDSLVNRLWPAFQHTSSSLKSAYSEVTGSEPAITSYNGVMCDTVDYIFYSSSSLDNVGVLETAPENRVKETGGTPNVYFPSDHVSLKAVLAFK